MIQMKRGHRTEHLLHTYNRFPVVFDQGEGVYLYDTEGKEVSGFCGRDRRHLPWAITIRSYNEALKEQIDKLMHTSNLYYTMCRWPRRRRLAKASGMDRVFLPTAARRPSREPSRPPGNMPYLKDGTTDHEIIAMEHSFHGRTMGALSVTGNAHYQEPFRPLIGRRPFADFNDLESVKAQVTEKTCAIIWKRCRARAASIRQIRHSCRESGSSAMNRISC